MEQTYSPDALMQAFIEILPSLFQSISIDSYSVLDAGGDGAISPVGKILAEIISILKNTGLRWPQGQGGPGTPSPA